MRAIPAFMGKRTVINSGDQSTEEIMQEVYDAHKVFRRDYDALADFFKAEEPEMLARRVFDFCKKNVLYKIEPGSLQTTRSPAGILAMREGDCKHYAALCAGILDALRRQYGFTYRLFYRFGSYDVFEMMPAHVFVVMIEQGREYWIDPVLKKFNQRNPSPIYYIDKKIPMALERISGLTQRQGFPASYQSMGETKPGGNLYDSVAAKVGSELNKVVANIPFVGLAQGLLTKFFGPGGLSDWINVGGILNEIKSAIFGRKYTKGQYTLGERFRYYVLGENIHTNDADVVTDAVVGTAITTFSVGFGIPITTNEDLDALSAGVEAYISRYVNYGGINAAEINRDAVQRAVTIKKNYFPGPQEGNYAAKGPAPQKWDLAKFNNVPYVIPIPDFTKLTIREMWSSAYSGPIPDGEVKDGIVIAGNRNPDGTITPIKPGGITTGTLLLIGAVVVGGYFIFKKK